MFLEYDWGIGDERSLHPDKIRGLLNKRYPYILSEREGRDPIIEVEYYDNYGLVVDEGALLKYIRGLRALSEKKGEVCEVPVHNKFNKLLFFITEDYTLSKSSPYGRAGSTIGLIPELFEIEVFVDKLYHPESLAEKYQTDISLSIFLEGLELYWITDFWQNFDVKNPKHQEMALNQTALHEVAHLGHIVQRFINFYLALKKAEEEYNISSLSKDEAWSKVTRLYDQVRFHTVDEHEAEAYSISTLKSIYEEQINPKIISLEEPLKFFAKLGI